MIVEYGCVNIGNTNIAVIFALGVVSSLIIKRVVMRAHHAEVDLWKLANDRGTAAAKYS